MASMSGTLVEQLTSNSNDHPQPKQKLLNTSSTSSPWQCAWGFSKSSNQSNQATSFEAVMSEQLADELQKSETVKSSISDFTLGSDDIISGSSSQKLLNEEATKVDSEGSPTDDTSNDDTANDAFLAQMLQTEMDKEYNQYITMQENQVNKNSKVRLLFTNYRTDEMFVGDEDSSDEEDEAIDDNLTSLCDPNQNMLEIKNDKGYVIFGKEVVTKHDSEICGRRNTARLEDTLPLQLRTGDATGMDIQLNNRIYNSLKKHAFSEQRRGQRLHENKEHSTAEHAVDERTRLILYRLVNRGIIEEVNGIISIGKEAVVVHVYGGDVAASDLPPIKNENNRDISCPRIPKECAIKIYKTTLNEFKARDKYIKDDYRFKDRFKKLNPRKIIHMWAEKEMHNLRRMREAGISCPEVVLLRKHVLVMSFIGHNQQPAPKLKSAILSSSEKLSAYQQVVDMMKTLHHTCRLVHADLSEFNLLWHEGKVWMIDVSQSVEPSHPHGLEFLLRDCTNISKFFSNIGVRDVLSPQHLFNEVSRLDIPVTSDAAFLSTIEKMEKSSEEHAQQSKRKSSEFLKQSCLFEC